MLNLFFAELIVVVAVVLISLVNFRFLTYPLFPRSNPLTSATHLSLEGNLFFISDLHLKADQPFNYSDDLRKVLEERKISQLIVVGDLFDSPEDTQEMLDANRDTPILRVLGVNGSPIQTFFVQGSPTHDPPCPGNLIKAGFTFLGKCAILSCGGFKVVVYHGHDLSRKGMIGHGWNRFISNLSLERTWKRIARVPESDWVFFGHLHIPGVDTKHKVANCGGWRTVRILMRPACTGIFLSPTGNAPEIVKVAEPKE
jgi:UDP-2,3-diacylglucosamine pyrophosphatase LpxH